MKLNLIVKMLQIEIIFALDFKINQNLIKGLGFVYLSRILSCTLALDYG